MKSRSSPPCGGDTMAALFINVPRKDLPATRHGIKIKNFKTLSIDLVQIFLKKLPKEWNHEF